LDDLPVKRLSQGQRRRAVLARLVVSESLPCWLLDEPFSALDASAIALVEVLINAHVARAAASCLLLIKSRGLAPTRDRTGHGGVSVLAAARCIVYRDLLLALRRRSDVATRCCSS